MPLGPHGYSRPISPSQTLHSVTSATSLLPRKVTQSHGLVMRMRALGFCPPDATQTQLSSAKEAEQGLGGKDDPSLSTWPREGLPTPRNLAIFEGSGLLSRVPGGILAPLASSRRPSRPPAGPGHLPGQQTAPGLAEASRGQNAKKSPPPASHGLWGRRSPASPLLPPPHTSRACVSVTQKQGLPNAPLVVLSRTWPNSPSEKHPCRGHPRVSLPGARGWHKRVPPEACPRAALVSLSAPLQPRRWARTRTFTPAGDSVTGGGCPLEQEPRQAGGKAAAPAVMGRARVMGHGSQPDTACLSKALCRLPTWQVAVAGRGAGRTSAGGEESQDPARDTTQKPEPSEITGHARGEVSTVISSLRPHSAGQMSKASFWVQGSGGEPGPAPRAHSPPPPTSHESREDVTGRRRGGVSPQGPSDAQVPS